MVRAMEATGVRRLIYQSTLGVGDSRDNLNVFWKHIMFGFLLHRACADHVSQEECVNTEPSRLADRLSGSLC
jgi:hypothetical protein